MRFLFVVHKNEEKAEKNSVLFHRLVLKERGLRPNGYFPLMRQPLFACLRLIRYCTFADFVKNEQKHLRISLKMSEKHF